MPVTTCKKFSVGHHAMIQKLPHQIVQTMTHASGIQNVGRQHCIKTFAPEFQTVATKNPLVKLEILSNLQGVTC